MWIKFFHLRISLFYPLFGNFHFPYIIQFWIKEASIPSLFLKSKTWIFLFFGVWLWWTEEDRGPYFIFSFLAYETGRISSKVWLDCLFNMLYIYMTLSFVNESAESLPKKTTSSPLWPSSEQETCISKQSSFLTHTSRKLVFPSSQSTSQFSDVLNDPNKPKLYS